MSDTSPLSGPLLSTEQTLWVLIAAGWFVIGGVALVDGRRPFGAAWFLLGLGGVYRIFRPD